MDSIKQPQQEFDLSKDIFTQMAGIEPFELSEQEDGSYVSSFCDAEGDEIKVEFHYDGAVTIITEGISYMMLTPNHLMSLARLIRKTEQLFASRGD